MFDVAISTNEVRKHLQRLGVPGMPSRRLVAAVAKIVERGISAPDSVHWEFIVGDDVIKVAIALCEGIPKEEYDTEFERALKVCIKERQ